MQSSPFKVKEYGSYGEYINHQKSKLDSGIKWLNGYNEKYINLLSGLLNGEFAGKSVLCIGARTGEEVAEFIRKGCFAVGIDFSYGNQNKYVLYGDASSLQYSDGSIDIVYTNALDHFLKIDEAISEINRVLKSGGYFLLLLVDKAETDKWGAVYWTDINAVIDYLSDTFELVSQCKVPSMTDWFSEFVVLRKK